MFRKYFVGGKDEECVCAQTFFPPKNFRRIVGLVTVPQILPEFEKGSDLG